MTAQRINAIALAILAGGAVAVLVVLGLGIGWLGNMVIAFGATVVLAAVLIHEWITMTYGGRLLYIAVVAQQAVLSYGSWEAHNVGSPEGPRTVLLALTFIGLVVGALVIAVEDQPTPRHP